VRCAELFRVIQIAYSGLTRRYEYWNPRNPSYQFLAEAKRLWEIEVTSGRIRLTTLQASILLFLVHHLNAMDPIGLPSFEQAMEMAQRIELFTLRPGKGQETRQSKSRTFTAWALFNFQW
jgi:hypothetical protein